jgi:hypothetical protein
MNAMKDTAIKTGTLLLFIGFIIGFVVYQSRYMNSDQPAYVTSPNGGVLQHLSDSIPKRDSLMHSTELLMSSSKAMIIKSPPPRATTATRDSGIRTDSILKLTFSPLTDSSIARVDQLLIVKTDTIVQDSSKQE